MCTFCGIQEASHDLLLLRVTLLTSGTGGSLAPRHWWRAAVRRLARWAGRPS